jgi:CheY-like chemotaxis protein
MMYTDAKRARWLEPFLERVLIVEPMLASARLLSELLKDAGGRQIRIEPTGARAMAACRELQPQMIFTEVGGQDLEGLDFVRDLRRSQLECRQAAVVVLTAEATARVIVAARNAGVHEFLRKPFTNRDLVRRLEAVAMHPRDWIEAVGYIGPDRRRFNSGDYEGPRKRRSDQTPTTPAARLEQALKIAKSAIASLESDPAQALRSLQVQASELKGLGATLPDAKLTAAAAKLGSVLAGATVEAGLPRAAIEGAAADLWPYLPVEDAPAKAVA